MLVTSLNKFPKLSDSFSKSIAKNWSAFISYLLSKTGLYQSF
jgi:hypothetical protein